MKQSKVKGREVKVEVHHPRGVVITDQLESIRREMFVPGDELEVLCVSCHKEHHHKEGK